MGIATQDPERRARFDSSPEQVVRYWRFIAEDVRRMLSEMGFRSLDEVIGHTELLVKKPVQGKPSHMDFSRMLAEMHGDKVRTSGQPDILARVFDRRIIEDCMQSLETGAKTEQVYRITNIDRSVGVMLSGEVARRGLHLKDDTIDVTFNGAAGQSFGAFLSKGITFRMKGLANDYVGKGLSGGRITVVPSDSMDCGAAIAGNTAMYGATSGELYVAGSVGERFCVRNSGAVAVAEGVGDHCCEYMTGGRVVVIGKCGRNFAAGMSAGIAYVLDEEGDFDRHCNMDMVELTLVESEADVSELKGILETHLKETGSRKAAEILEDWDAYLPRFIKVMPVGYKLILEKESE